MTPGRAAMAAVAVALVLTVACSDDDADDPALSPSSSTAAPSTTEEVSTTSTSAEADAAGLDGELPPPSALSLEPIYGERLAELGLRLTARGGLIDRTHGYEPSAEGTHLALYVEPIGDRQAEQYVEGLGTVTALFSDVFGRWPGLETFDVCQEPVAGDEGADEPLPITQIELSRAQATAFDWSTARAVDVVRASLDQPRGISLRISPSITEHPSYQAVLDAARSSA